MTAVLRALRERAKRVEFRFALARITEMLYSEN
jgi:hypothetical protein